MGNNKVEMKLVGNDVGFVDDAIFLIRNLLAKEQHCALSYVSTQDPRYIEELKMTRERRTEILKLIVKKEEGQLWCISKHSLACVEGFLELANRFISANKMKNASILLEYAADEIMSFMALNGYADKEIEITTEA